MANFPVTPEPVSRGEAITEGDDALQILADQDVTAAADALLDGDEERLGADGSGEDNYLSLENEPPDFIRGEVDVAKQMERTTRRMDYAGTSSLIRGARDDDFETQPRRRAPAPDVGDLPAEIDTAALQGEELHERAADLDGGEGRANADDFVEGADHSPRRSSHGTTTGALTDLGAGRSGVTRRH